FQPVRGASGVGELWFSNSIVAYMGWKARVTALELLRFNSAKGASMTRSTRMTFVTRWSLLATARTACLPIPTGPARADVGPDEAGKLYERVSPSLVVVKYTWEGEMGRREMAGTGIVVGKDGLIM